MLHKMKSAVERLLAPPPIKKIMQSHLYEAERQELEHNAAAEHHEALAMMYRGRAERLRDHLGYDLRPLKGNDHLHGSMKDDGFQWVEGKR
jgi:hypothetical protein